MLDDKPNIGIAAAMVACGILIYALPDSAVDYTIAVIGINPASPTGSRLGGLIKIVALIVALVGGRRLYVALKKN